MASTRLCCWLFALSGCSFSVPELFPPGDELAGTATRGERNQAGFSFFSDTRSLTTPMAAGGARASVEVTVRSGNAPIARVESSDPSVFTAVYVNGQVTVTSGAAGQASLILRSASNYEIDATTITVAETTELTISGPWTGSRGPTLMAGGRAEFHVSTRRNGKDLVGIGAVHFTASGGLTVSPSQAVFPGDQISVSGGAAGDAVVTASCPSATAELPVTVIDPAQITSLRPSALAIGYHHSDPFGVSFTMKASNAAGPVYGAMCQWSSTPAGLTIVLQQPPPLFEDDGSIRYVATGAPGSYQARCDLPGGPSATISVTID